AGFSNSRRTASRFERDVLPGKWNVVRSKYESTTQCVVLSVMNDPIRCDSIGSVSRICFEEIENRQPMLTGKIRNDIDKLWEKFWTGGITNPLTVIEQISYLMFARMQI